MQAGGSREAWVQVWAQRLGVANKRRAQRQDGPMIGRVCSEGCRRLLSGRQERSACRGLWIRVSAVLPTRHTACMYHSTCRYERVVDNKGTVSNEQ